MNSSELEKELQKAGIDKKYYSLIGGIFDNTFCLEKRGELWVTYYTEKGYKLDEQFFANESDACTSFLKEIINEFKG